jgi:hypothetical protein
MEKPTPPVMDLVELKKQILDKEPAAALPCQLSDYWLDQVEESLEQVLENPDIDAGSYLAGPLALVVHILFARTASHELEVSHSQLYECLRSYRIEVALEAVSRRTNVKSAPASLDTIFADRLVTSIWIPPDD